MRTYPPDNATTGSCTRILRSLCGQFGKVLTTLQHSVNGINTGFGCRLLLGRCLLEHTHKDVCRQKKVLALQLVEHLLVVIDYFLFLSLG